MAAKNVLAVSSGNFDAEVLKTKGLVLVDFWAEWCPPCKMLAPVIDILSEEFAGRLKVCKLDVDANQDIAARYGVMSIPTVIFFRDGKIVERAVGYQPKEEFIVIIERSLSPSAD